VVQTVSEFERMNIVLVGFMGTGKSAVGERLAVVLGWPFLDTDAVIEERAGCRIAEIFARAGEPGFRDQESAVVAEAAARDRAVIATGGGALGREENVACLKTHGRLVCLTARPEVILERTHPWGDRPLLATASDPRQAVERLLCGRAPLYALADLTIDTSDLTVEEVAGRILLELGLAGDAAVSRLGGRSPDRTPK
jgi:shikimate kinase